MATAILQYRVNGGAVHTDSVAVASGDVISFLAASYAGWNTPAVTWEIIAYPPGWAVPSGWSENTSSGYYYYRANSGVSGIVPPPITIPDPATTWGKWHFRLTVNGTILSSVIGVETVSPTLSLHDLAVREGAQWDSKRRWVGDQQDNMRIVDDAALTATVGAVDAHYWEDAAVALNVNGVATRAMSATLGVVGVAVTPIRVTYKAAAGGGVVEGFRVAQQINAGDAGTGGEGVKTVFVLPDVAGAATICASIRAETTNLDGSYSGKLVIATRNAGTETDWLTLSATGGVRLHAFGAGFVRSDADGVLSASALSSGDVTGALGYTPVTDARTLTGTSPITIAGDNAAHDLSADRTIAFTVAADVPWAGHGITGIASLDNSGAGLAIGANTTSQTIGKASTTASFLGAVSAAGSITAGTGGFIGEALDRVNAGALTLGKTNATSIDLSSRPVTSVLSLDAGATNTLSIITNSVTRAFWDNAGKGRSVFVPHVVTSSGGALTLPLATSKNIRHSLTEETTASFTGATPGLKGKLEFVQGGTPFRVHFPASSGGAVEYDAAIVALGLDAIVDMTASTRTLLSYYVTDTPVTRVYIYGRSVSATIP